ncbi:MAG: hypothetical protein QXG86_02080 [Candidatus Woesearchaeota archaeon]
MKKIIFLVAIFLALINLSAVLGISASDLEIKNTSVTLVRDVGESKTMYLSLTNKGNTTLNLNYYYTNFTYYGAVLKTGNSGSLTLMPSETKTIPIALSITDTTPNGMYRSTLNISGTINKTAYLNATVRNAILNVSVPEFLMDKSERNKTISKKFTIKNAGDYDLNDIIITTDADEETYHPVIEYFNTYLPAGSQMEVNVILYIPDYERPTLHKIGNIYFDSDMFDKTSDLKVNVTSKLRINSVTLKINDQSKTLKSSGETHDKEKNYPGSYFSAEVELCNDYPNKDEKISDVTIEATFEGVDNEDDIEGTVDEFDIKGDTCVKKTIEFEKDRIGWLVDEGEYNLVISAEGYDENDRLQEAEWTIYAKIVRDENPHISFNEVSISPSEISCDRTLVLKASAYSIGDSDRDSWLKITNPSLKIDIQKAFRIGEDIGNDCDAIEEPDEKCIGFDKTFTITLPDIIPVGEYPIDFALYVENSKRTDYIQKTLKVNACGSAMNTNQTTGTTPISGPITGTIETQQQQNVSIGGSSQGVIITGSPASASSGRTTGTPVRIRKISDNNLVETTAIITGIVLALIIIIAVIVALLRKPETP